MQQNFTFKSITYFFIILPLGISLIYASIQFLVSVYILYPVEYERITTVFSTFLLSLVLLIFSLIKKDNIFIQDLSKYGIILYASCLFSFIPKFWKFNFGKLHYCKRNFDISYVENVYEISTILTCLTMLIFFKINHRLNLKFTSFHIIIFICAMTVQFFITKSFRMI